MKAERRHELKENALAKQAVRAVKVMQMPDWRRKYASRAALVLAAIVLVAALVLHRINASREDQQRAIDHLARARFEIEQQLRSAEVRATRQPELDAKFYSQVEAVAEQASSDLEQVGKLVTDPKLLSQAAVLRGDLFYTVANLPLPPASTTTAAASKPAPSLKMSREEYLSQASTAYKEVIDKYADQPLAVIAAQFGLGAIDENNRDWDAAAGKYKVIIENPNSSPAMREHAKLLLANLENLKHPPLLAKAPTDPLIAPTTQKATTQTIATSQPQTQPATATTTPSATTTAARPQ